MVVVAVHLVVDGIASCTGARRDVGAVLRAVEAVQHRASCRGAGAHEFLCLSRVFQSCHWRGGSDGRVGLGDGEVGRSGGAVVVGRLCHGGLDGVGSRLGGDVAGVGAVVGVLHLILIGHAIA